MWGDVAVVDEGGVGKHMSQEQDFQVALSKYLKDVHKVSIFGPLGSANTADDHTICMQRIYLDENGNRTRKLVVANTSRLKFLEKIAAMFEGKIGRVLVERLIEDAIYQMDDFPCSHPEFEHHSLEIFNKLQPHFKLKAEAIVPLNNINIYGYDSIPLASSILNVNRPEVLLSLKASHPEFQDDIANLDGKCFLTFPVLGDDESRERQVEIEVQKSLTVLRFVAMWSSKIRDCRRVKYNPATVVTAREQGKRFILYQNVEEANRLQGYKIDFVRYFFFRQNEIKFAHEYFGLDDINYHYANVNNVLSQRVVRALEMYDSGVTALTNWQSTYRYIASINIALPKSKSNGQEIVKRLTTLIKFGGYFVGNTKEHDTEDDEENNSDIEDWEGMIVRTASPFEGFYALRGKILHGNLPLDEVSDETTEECRVLAHNAVRLLAYLTREFNWQNDKDADKWFKSPVYPPSLKQSTITE